MTSEKPKSPSLFKFVPILEKVFLCAVAIGIALAVSGVDFLVLRFSLIGLAAMFFLFAFRPPAEIQVSDNKPFGFSETLALVIIPKVLWISSAISVVGIGIHFFELGNKGYKQALLTGMLSISICLVVLIIFLITGVRQLKIMGPVLLRAIPALLGAIYFLTR